jgi:hypothetical protein
LRPQSVIDSFLDRIAIISFFFRIQSEIDSFLDRIAYFFIFLKDTQEHRINRDASISRNGSNTRNESRSRLATVRTLGSKMDACNKRDISS